VDEITEEFLIESREAVDQLDRDLVELEASPEAKDVVGRVFRALHTIKGSCGFLGFDKLGRVAHAGESLLAKIRDGKGAVTPEVAAALLTTIDALRLMLEAIGQSGQDGEQDYLELTAELTRLAEGDPVSVHDPVLVHDPVVVQELAAAPSATPPPGPGTALLSLRPVPPPALKPTPASAPAQPAPELVQRSPDAGTGSQSETVRVDVELLDRLMDLAGELVLTRNQVREIQLAIESTALAGAMQRFNLVTAGLQDGIMRMRMQPVEHLFGKFPRLVRDTAKQCGKLASVELIGKDAELDRSLLEAIKDPLTHLIRNAVDHGVESPEARVRSGKPAEGRVTVKAVHQSGHVAIEISDDGAGIPLDRVRQKAVAKGLLTPERAAQMSDAESTALIFLPGLSTASNITSVSGRGVGMDVVKTNVERLGGTVEVETRPGAGTTFRLKLPLTLAIVPALVVEAAGERYAIPQVHLQELVLLDNKKQRLETVYDAPVFRLRDRLLPIVFLSELLGRASAAECLARPKSHLAILQINGLWFGLAVDRVIDQQEVVVKPLAPQLKEVALYSACTILGDGRVVLILDVTGVAQRARISKPSKVEIRDAAAVVGELTSGELSSFLLVAERADLRVALPLERVTRLETVARSRLERSGMREVLQQQGEIVPLLRLRDMLPPGVEQENDDELAYVNVVILATAVGSVGVLVTDVIDVVELRLPASGMPPSGPVLASVVVQERVTDVLDIDNLLAQFGVQGSQLLRSA
jgi:two-component system chemotaxis sensor kinase CheA